MREVVDLTEQRAVLVLEAALQRPPSVGRPSRPWLGMTSVCRP
jgi:hypothetical protein